MNGWLTAWGRPGLGAQFRLTVPRRAGEVLVTSPLPMAPRDLPLLPVPTPDDELPDDRHGEVRRADPAGDDHVPLDGPPSVTALAGTGWQPGRGPS